MKPFRTTSLPRLCAALCLLLAAGGCALGPEPQGIRPDPAAIRALRVQIAPEHLGAAGGDPKRLAAMADRIARNLGTWGYPVAADGKDYSHVLEARVGAVAHKGTPVGFSFSVGNSDPRAAEFQKAEVLPVDCVLYPAGRSRDKASLYMDFVAGEGLKAAGGADLADIYVEHMATVCFNLLDDLRAPRTPPAAVAAGGAAATWMPEIRVEIRDKPGAPSATPAPVPVPVPTPAVVPSAVLVPISPQTGGNPAPNPPAITTPAIPKTTVLPPAPATPASTTPVTTETRQGEGRKQMIIHNQGSPIILEFGYERK